MAINKKKLADLTAKMAQLNLPDPADAARQELETGSPILAMESFLKWLTDEMVQPGDFTWIDRALENPDDFPVLAPVLKRLFKSKVSRDDLNDLVRVMQFKICDHICFMVDSVAMPGYVPIQEFGLYVVGGGDSPTTDKPIVRLDALHEQIGAWNPLEE